MVSFDPEENQGLQYEHGYTGCNLGNVFSQIDAGALVRLWLVLD